MVTEKRVTPSEAIVELSNLLSDYDSFARSFDHSDHADNDSEEDCRFDQYLDNEAFNSLENLIAAATEVLTIEALIRQGEWRQDWPDVIEGLAKAMGTELPDQNQDGIFRVAGDPYGK